MARVPVSGNNDEALTAPGTDTREVISGLDPDGDGKVFWCTNLEISNEHASQVAVVEIYDSDEDTGVAASAQRGVYHVPPGDTVAVDYPAPGRKFVTSMVAALTNGTINANGGIRASGYLE